MSGTRQFFTVISRLRGRLAGRAARNCIATPSSRRRVDGEDDAMIQHERAVNLISTQAGWDLDDAVNPHRPLERPVGDILP